MKRVLILSDLHCGHRVGLTPEPWQYPVKSDAVRYKWGKVQRQCWKWYVDSLKEHGPFDVVILNGDAVDGKGFRSGGTEQITTDRLEQVEMAALCVREAQTKDTKVIVVRGTPYHCGADEDLEDALAREVGAIKVGNHEWPNVEGVVFDVKHAVGSSSVPHGRHTAISRERLWGLLWAERGEAPKADVFIRSHVHYHSFAGGPGWLAMTTPALQSLGSKYGAKMCAGVVDFGFVVFDCEDGAYSWEAVMHTVASAVPRELKV